jgi:hypothetical protein
MRICRRLRDSGLVDFFNIVRGHIEHDAPLYFKVPRSMWAK